MDKLDLSSVDSTAMLYFHSETKEVNCMYLKNRELYLKSNICLNIIIL